MGTNPDTSSQPTAREIELFLRLLDKHQWNASETFADVCAELWRAVQIVVAVEGAA